MPPWARVIVVEVGVEVGVGVGVGVGVLNLAPQVNLLCVFRALDGVSGGRKIYTGSGRTSLHPVIDGLHYRHH